MTQYAAEVPGKSSKGYIAYSMYVLLNVLAAAGYALHNARVFHPWGIGDWVVSYHAGFVRRGLTGELLFGVARVAHIPIQYGAIALQVLTLSTVSLAVLYLLRGLRPDLWTWALLLSPGALFSQILEPPGVMRKEFLLLAALGILLVLIRHRAARGEAVPSALLGGFLSLAAAVCVLSHEGMGLYMAYVFAAVWIAEPRWQRALAICAPAAVIALVCMLASATHIGGPAVAQKICASIGGDPARMADGRCAGAIAYLAVDSNYARAETQRKIENEHYARTYGIAGALAVLPWIGAMRSARRRSPKMARDLKVLGWASALSWLASVPLFVLAHDWGRWIMIHTICSLLLLLFILQRAGREGWARPQETPKAGWIAVALYAVSWTLPGAGIFPSRTGYFGLYKYFRGYKTATHPKSDVVGSLHLPACGTDGVCTERV